MFALWQSTPVDSFGHVFDLEKRNFLYSQSKLEADPNRRRVLSRVSMLLDNT
ncbi:hypothetical protein [Marinobacter nauticus]|uniref:hypothetical protein n=1 Tax=Marinobacter nauticus TaxID=2743 RepID=UPI00160F7D3B|nr:hypothetical protein [Marinobacter nauticus]